MYYGLSNFYQNHRRYVKSRDDDQLLGARKTPNTLSEDCQPFQKKTEGDKTYGYAPCGAIANSLFNGMFYLVSGRQADLSLASTIHRQNIFLGWNLKTNLMLMF